MAKVKAFFRQWFLEVNEEDTVLFLGDLQGELMALQHAREGR